MLKITTRVDGTGTTFELEGKLAGPWVDELEKCWQESAVRADPVTVALKSVSFIDGPGRDLLKKMCGLGAELVADGCMTKAIVAAIKRGKTDE